MIYLWFEWIGFYFSWFFFFCRELVARVILETLRSIPVPDTSHDLSRVLAIISRLGEDPGNNHKIIINKP